MAPPRPRWEANNKKQVATKPQKAQKTKPATSAPAPSIPLDLQQLLLNIFKNSFHERFEVDIKPLLQEVKGHLYNRDFATAFGKQEHLEAYAARWSASRALGYADLFWGLREEVWGDAAEGDEEGAKEKKRGVVCLGGGAGAEVVALAGVLKMLGREDGHKGAGLSVRSVDMADWSAIIERLAQGVVEAPPLSKYASAAIQAANGPLINPAAFAVSFHQHDILHEESDTLSNLIREADLVTLMFTLNELYSTSLSLTQKFLLNLTNLLPVGALLLVVDSPGSYSTITLNGAEKKYPMQWLLDHTLLNQSKEEAKWEKIHEDESRWFRLGLTLQYPIELENMRMQVHLYRRV
jgi:25S rRNA (uracil2843-N3)-methyltransferase